jgi:Xaa-Pro dipeptidase
VALHFERREFDIRVACAREALRREKLDAILLFAQESLYYLAGFDTSGFVLFQCAVLTAGSDPIVLLTRRPDLEQAQRTSTITDVRL